MPKRGRKPSHDLSDLTCPNPLCPDRLQPGPPAIVANGTYHSQNGIGRRYRCRTCGISFCSRTGSPFYELRSPVPKLLSALKLMLKGVTIRQTAELLSTNPVTVRAWLRLAQAHRDEISRLLLAEPGVTPAQLQALFDCLDQNRLRKRAVLARKRSGWRK